MTDSRGVDAVERALSVLDAFGPDDKTLTLAELARRTGLYKSTILRLGVSLERYGYVVRGADSTWRLGPAAWRLGAIYRGAFSLSQVLRPELKQLSDATGETASFYVREGDRRVCLYRHEPDRPIRHTLIEGALMELGVGASGKVLSAYSGEGPDDGRRIRKAGFAVSHGERDPDVAAVAVPVLRPDGKLAGALALSGLITRFDTARLEAMRTALAEARARIEPQLVS